MASPSYIRNGYIYLPAVEVGVGGLVGVPAATVYSNFTLAPAATGAIILDQLVLPAGTFDVAGRLVYIQAWMTTVNNVNSKTLTLNFGGTGAVGGAVTGGATVATQAGTTIAAISAFGTVIKSGSNTQQLFGETVAGATVGTLSTGQGAITDTGNVNVNLVVNAATAASDITNVCWYVQIA